MTEPTALGTTLPTTLPAPLVLELLDFEHIYTAVRADLLARAPELQGVLTLESEPLTKLLQAFAYRELLYRARLNDAMRSFLLAYASGSDLDHKGQFYGCPRMTGEGDDRYRARIGLRIRALAGNGTKDAYEEMAMATSLDIRDAVAVQVRPGYVQILIWPQPQATDPEALRTAVAEQVNSPRGRPLGVPVSVQLAKPRPIDVHAHIWRTAAAPLDLATRLTTRLQTALSGHAKLGGNVARSWITAQLHTDGVAAVRFVGDTEPAESTPLASNEFPAPGVLRLIDKGVQA